MGWIKFHLLIILNNNSSRLSEVDQVSIFDDIKL